MQQCLSVTVRNINEFSALVAVKPGAVAWIDGMKNKCPRIAVIMSVYINDKFNEFKEAFDSIINQTYSNFVFFIYADGKINPDIESFLQNYNSQHVIFIRSEKNKVLAYALNKLISVALVNNEFDFIARMDADDISLEDRFQRQIDFFMANPELDVVGGLCQEFGGESAREKCKIYFTDEAIKNNAFKKCPFVHPTVMFKSSVFNNGMRYPENQPLTEDMCLWLELISANKKFANIDSVLLKYRINEQTLKRRRGLNKAVTELSTRLYYAKKLKMLSVRNLLYILIHFGVRVLPSNIFKLVHKLN